MRSKGGVVFVVVGDHREPPCEALSVRPRSLGRCGGTEGVRPYGFLHGQPAGGHEGAGADRARQYVLDSEWGEVQPKADDENAFLEAHSWAEYGEWFLGLTDDATDETKGRYAFVFGDFRRIHRSGLIACQYRAAEWRHKKVELAAHRLLQRLDSVQA